MHIDINMSPFAPFVVDGHRNSDENLCTSNSYPLRSRALSLNLSKIDNGFDNDQLTSFQGITLCCSS
jgi:hypothetical protein